MKIDSILDLEIKELKENGANEIGYTKSTCINYGVYSTAYLFWKINDSTFIQKFKHSEYNKDSTQKSERIQIIDSVFFSFYNIHEKSLKSENVENFKSKPDSIVGNMTYSSRVTISHSCYRHFVVKSGNENFHKQFNRFDLKEYNEEKVHASKRKYTKEEIKKWKERGWELDEYKIIHENFPIRNINYQHNKELKIVEWDKVISKFIEYLETKNTFDF
ncbi:hypothetical protein AB9K26_00985 [Psychroserpens sp. XS_ASV72]|uniref:hypothetical protein n=1 Tax=Psychroserpens sp. XS_ASV72 TaxID=3241293 RepID=UPI003517305D